MRVAVFGCGSIGRRHLRNIRALGYTDLVAFDPSPESRAMAASETRARYASSLDAVWQERPDVVVITSPPNAHTELARAAADHGCHFFVEKPLSNSLDGLDDLVSDVERRNLVTMVGCNMRFHPGPARVKALLDEGAIGTVLSARIYAGSYLPEWRPGTDYRAAYSANAAEGGGAILDFIHELDLALWYFGDAVPLACATVPASAIGLEVEGSADMLLKHHSGALSNVHVSFIQRDYRRGCEISGTDGTLVWDFGEPVVRLYRTSKWETFPHAAEWMVNQMYMDEMSHFLRHAESGNQTSGPLNHGVAALRLALACKTIADTSAAPAALAT